MNNGYIFCSDMYYGNSEDVWYDYPDAMDVLEVDGGWVAFNSIADFDDWLENMALGRKERNRILAIAGD